MMDRICDNIVEEILRHLPAMYLHRVGAVARRYNIIVSSADFRARYWESHSPYLSGMFLQNGRPWRQHSRFLMGPSGRPSMATESIFGSDLAFLPRPGVGEIFIVHATAGLLLCSHRKYMPVHYYVCNPVTWQWVALPELPWLPADLYGIMSVTHNRSVTDNRYGSIKCFEVVLVNHVGGGCMDLNVFSSATGRWEARRVQPPAPIDVQTYVSPSLGQSGTAYWIGYRPIDKLIVYSCLHHTIQVFLPPPGRVHHTTALNRCIGERPGGGLRYAHFDCSVFLVWDLQAGGVDGVWWKPVHQIGVMELAQRNPEATALFTESEYVEYISAKSSNQLFLVIGFHPTADSIFFNVNQNVCAYSIEHGTITYQRPGWYFNEDVFPYMHPAHPVEIPAINKAPLALKHS